MYDPATEAPTNIPIEHNRARFHQAHGQELSLLINLDRQAKTDHAGDIIAPRGLTQGHKAVVATLNRIAAITHGLRLPFDACGSWRRCNAVSVKLAEDLDQHWQLDDNVQFARFEAAS